MPFAFEPREPQQPYHFSGDRIDRADLSGWIGVHHSNELELCFGGRRYFVAFDSSEAFEMFHGCLQGGSHAGPRAGGPRCVGVFTADERRRLVALEPADGSQWHRIGGFYHRQFDEVWFPID